MYVSIRRYGVDPKDVPEIAKRVREGFVPIVREIVASDALAGARPGCYIA